MGSVKEFLAEHNEIIKGIFSITFQIIDYQLSRVYWFETDGDEIESDPNQLCSKAVLCQLKRKL